ncbi:hypothetical protein HYH02_001313 [Chlamydomonas schloesseri]|uniref:Uncharacterized protein n=1 Tax=Chlamydomonas schloesseri TaxID=2026947 RepID=A0A836BC99_9CHLO|nr:hypothetical protein HYH02_001313 [Chlamydomonas schloesseri]|eukprot:KAG2454282.1 hypothetical protein HYH02_001313 [Chlamydomonas schloesseri]
MAMPPPAKNNWSTGMCDWCAPPGGCGICLLACLCPCCMYGQYGELMPPTVCCGGSCGGSCCAMYALSIIGVPCVLQMQARGHLRMKYNIPGSACNDCCLTCWCSPCTMCQEYRECHIRGMGKGGVDQGIAVAMSAPPAPQAIDPAAPANKQ